MACCSYCGESLKEDAKFCCNACGRPLPRNMFFYQDKIAEPVR